MTKLLTATAFVLALAVPAVAGPKSETPYTDMVVNGIRKGTPDGRELSAKLFYYSVTCPDEMSKTMEEVQVRIMLKNGGMNATKDYDKSIQSEIRRMSKDVWREGMRSTIDKIEAMANKMAL